MFNLNPRSFLLKKYIHDILPNDYKKHENIVERISSYLVTEKDITEFISMIGDLYISGFKSAIDQHKEQLKKLGMKVNVINTPLEGNKIFQSEKSG